MTIVFWIIVGGIAGWLAEQIMKANHGLLTIIILGIIGAVVGGWMFGWIGSIVTAMVGALVVIYVYRLIKGRA